MKRCRSGRPPKSRSAYFRALRLALGISVEEVAKVSGLSLAYVSALEAEARPLLPHLEEILRLTFDKLQARVYDEAARREAARREAA